MRGGDLIYLLEEEIDTSLIEKLDGWYFVAGLGVLVLLYLGRRWMKGRGK